MSDKSKCEHKNFHANVNVNRLTDGEGGPIKGFSAEISIKCVDCNEPFEFIGAPAGYSFRGPTTSVDFKELRVPIRPDTDQIATHMKFQVRSDNDTPKDTIN